MKRPIWLVVGVAAAVLVGWLVLRQGSGEEVAVDLVEQFPNATQKRPSPEAFSVVDATLGGESKRAILIKETSRLIWSVTVPDNGELKVSLGLLEDGWAVEGDGVLFRVLVGAGGPPEEILNLLINPYGNAADRGWHDLSLDLSEFAGETISLLFNTNSSPPMRPPVDNRNGDFAVWGAPRIVTR
jgi:hypothetical protein